MSVRKCSYCRGQCSTSTRDDCAQATLMCATYTSGDNAGTPNGASEFAHHFSSDHYRDYYDVNQRHVSRGKICTKRVHVCINRNIQFPHVCLQVVDPCSSTPQAPRSASRCYTGSNPTPTVILLLLTDLFGCSSCVRGREIREQTVAI